MEILKYSPSESRQFGLNVYRGMMDDIRPDEILNLIFKQNIDIAIVRIPSDKQDKLARLDEIGVPYLFADTLVYYYIDLRSYEPENSVNTDIEFVEFGAEYSDISDKLISEIFFDYKNHYHSNPLLNINIVEAYKEWAKSYYTKPDKYSWLVKKGNRFVALAICDMEDGECNIILNGVIPSESGKGIYKDIIRFIQRYLKAQGIDILKVSTQIHNHRVQKVLAKEGFFLKQAFITIHINSLMNISQVEKKVFDITITEDSCYQIYHIISKYYSKEFPGNGSIITNSSYQCLKPVCHDRQYRLEIAFPCINKEKGVYTSLVKVTDSDGDLCLISYNDLLKPSF